MPSGLDFVVARDDLRRTRFAPAQQPDNSELRRGEVLLQIERFGFSANNITYATLGEAMRYWQFFPAPDGWGRVPVSGYAAVAASAHDELEVGERVFGYLRTSTHLLVMADRVKAGRFIDAAPHRADLPAVYQRYPRLGMRNDDPRSEDLQALWRPLFMTSFRRGRLSCRRRRLWRRADRGVERIEQDGNGHRVPARPGPSGDRCRRSDLARVPFAERAGYYDCVIAYDDLHELSPDIPLVFVDVAGDDWLLSEVRRLAGDGLRRNVVVGATHWQQRAVSTSLRDNDAELFFLPPWIEKRRREWGGGEFARRYDEAWSAFLPTVDRWMQIHHHSERDDVEAAYRRTLDGAVDPAVGQILSLRD